MTLQAFPGGNYAMLGPSPFEVGSSGVTVRTGTINAASAASIYIGRIITADGGSHTIDTTGSSKIEWRSDSGVTFANAGTSVSVGLAPVDTTAGPTARASNTAGAISFDVKGVFAGGGGGITNNAWQTSVPTTGTKTVANGDLVAFAVQMTARGGADAVTIDYATTMAGTTMNRPTVTKFNGTSTYTNDTGLPNCIITFSDGTLGWFEGGDIFSTINTRTWNSGSATKEYGQLIQMPFPMKVYGIYGVAALSNDCDMVLYSDPTGTPVAEKTASMDANTIGTTSGAFFREIFASPYSATANQALGVIFKPGASNVSAYYKTLNGATHRAADVWGTSGYGISRASGAFANANSSLDHYYIGLLVGAFDGGGGGGTSRARSYAGI